MGLFDRQKLFRGEKLTEAYPSGQPFVLYDLAVVVEDNTDLIEGSTVDKVELVTGTVDGGEPILTSTLAGAIVRLAYGNVRDAKGKAKADDLPAIVTWKRVETKNNFDNEATVLEMVAPYEGPKPKTVPPWSFPPITNESNPL